MNHSFSIRPAEKRDIPAITSLYNHYVVNSTSTYAEEAYTENLMMDKFLHITSSGYPFFLAECEDGTIGGYAYVDRFRPQSAWKLVETTIYIDPEAKGMGTGGMLYEWLVAAVREHEDVIGIVAVISLDNAVSIRFHEKRGFELVGKFEDCAVKFGKSIGSGCWLLRLRGQEQ